MLPGAMPSTRRCIVPWIAGLAALAAACDTPPQDTDSATAKSPKAAAPAPERKPPGYERAIPPSTRGTYPPKESLEAAPNKAPMAGLTKPPSKEPEPREKKEPSKPSARKPDLEQVIPPTTRGTYSPKASEVQATASPPKERAEAPEPKSETTSETKPERDPAEEPSALAASKAEDAPATEPISVETTQGAVLGLPYTMVDLPNGLRVLALKNDVPDVVSLQIVVRTGSRNEVEPGKSGFAHFFEHMMFRGTKNYPPETYAAIVKNAGADQNAYTSDDLTNYHITFTKNDLDQILKIEADRFKNLNYSVEQFRTEAQAVKGEYLKNYSNPIQKMLEKIRGMAFTTHPYEHTTMGFFDDIEQMPEQFEYSKVFFDRFYRPENTVVILVGDIEPEAATEKVVNYFGDWQRGNHEAEIPAEPPPTGPKHEHIEWETATQPWLLLAFRGPAFDASEATLPALDAVATLAFSEASPLYRKIVIEEQWADELWAWFPKRRDPHLLHIGVRLLKPEYATEVRDAIYAALTELKEAPLHPSWIERTKSRLRYEMTAMLDDSPSVAATLASFVHFDRTPETLDELLARYAELTPDIIQTAAKTYFSEERRFLVTLSNEPALPGLEPESSLEGARTSTPAARAPSAEAPYFSGAVEAKAPPELDTKSSTVTFPVRTKLLQSRKNPLVTLSFVFTVGSAYDPPGKKGLAALTAAMLADGGTEELTISEINQAMYPMATDFDWQVDKEMTRLSGTVHRDKLKEFYAFAAAQLLEPGFREEDLERNKKKLISRIKTDLVANNDEELAKEVLYGFIYGELHPYGTFNLGIASEVEKLTLDDVKRFYREHYGPRGVILGLAGGFPERFPRRVEKDLAMLPARSDPVTPIEVPEAPTGRRALIIEKKTPGVAVSMGFPITVRRGDTDWVALWLARSWLGEHRSTSSHLFQEIREKRGMNYGDYAYIEYFPRGMFQFHPDTNLARRQQIFQIWLRPFRNNIDAHFGTRLALYELDKLVERGMTAEDFEATRSYLRKFVALLTQTQSRQLGYAIDSTFYGIPEFATYVRRGLDALTLEAVNAAIREHLDPKTMSFVFVTRDAASLLRRLARDMPSPIEYNTPKPELTEVDKEVAELKIGLESVTFVPVEEVF